MKTPLILIVCALLATPLQAADAQEESVQSTRSAGKHKADAGVDLAQRLRDLAPVVKPLPAQSEDYASRPQNQALAGIANRHDQLFTIYSADVQLLADQDGDGFHHAINVGFDVDVNHDSATVYAKLYLSREGGPWVQYFTTDLFAIHIDDAADAYEVQTELLEGYPSGYYDVLIEIYSLDHAYLVASEVLDYHYLGKDVALEDLYRDEPYDVFYGEVSVSSGAGDASALLAFFLLFQVAIAARRFLASSPPCKLAKNNNQKRIS